jgi:hypothetical protein
MCRVSQSLAPPSITLLAVILAVLFPARLVLSASWLCGIQGIRNANIPVARRPEITGFAKADELFESSRSRPPAMQTGRRNEAAPAGTTCRPGPCAKGEQKTATLQSGLSAKLVGLIGALPGEAVTGAAEVTVRRGLLVNRAAQLEVAQDGTRAQVEVLVHQLDDRRPGDLLSARPGPPRGRRGRPRRCSWQRTGRRTRPSGPPWTGPCRRTRRRRAGRSRRRCRR